MNDFAPILEQLRIFAEQQSNVDIIARAVPISIVSLVIGIGLSVLGAKLAKPGVTLLSAIVGGLVGVWFADAARVSQPVGGVIGGLMGVAMFGTIAHLTFRIWVGVAAAVVLASLSLGTFGKQRILPHYADFASTDMRTAVDSVGFAVPTAEERNVYLERTPREFAQQFWAFVNERDLTVELDGKLVAVAAAVAGLFLGVVAVRWMLILSTSIIGTVLVATGITALFDACFPGFYAALERNPDVTGMGIGAFLVTSLILQTLLTRKAPEGKKQPA